MTSYVYRGDIPPSANTSYRVNYKTKKLFVTARTAEFRKVVRAHWLTQKKDTFVGDIAVTMKVCAKNKKKRDLDNLIKPTLDAFQLAGVFVDDSHVTRILAEKCRCTQCEHQFVTTVTES